MNCLYKSNPKAFVQRDAKEYVWDFDLCGFVWYEGQFGLFSSKFRGSFDLIGNYKIRIGSNKLPKVQFNKSVLKTTNP